MKLVFGVLMLSICIFVVFFGLYWVYEARVFSSSVKASSTKVSSDNSYCFTSPICVDADGLQTERVTILCLNGKGSGVSGLSGQLTTDSEVSYKVVQARSDSEGKVIFDLTSKVKKDLSLLAFCGKVQIKCKPQICFR